MNLQNASDEDLLPLFADIHTKALEASRAMRELRAAVMPFADADADSSPGNWSGAYDSINDDLIEGQRFIQNALSAVNEELKDLAATPFIGAKGVAKQVDAPATFKDPNADLVERDISSEEWREVITGGQVIRIDAPQKLITRPGGTTHRVVDATGTVYCYPAPETGHSALRWKAKYGYPPVAF